MIVVFSMWFRWTTIYRGTVASGNWLARLGIWSRLVWRRIRFSMFIPRVLNCATSQGLALTARGNWIGHGRCISVWHVEIETHRLTFSRAMTLRSSRTILNIAAAPAA